MIDANYHNDLNYSRKLILSGLRKLIKLICSASLVLILMLVSSYKIPDAVEYQYFVLNSEPSLSFDIAVP